MFLLSCHGSPVSPVLVLSLKFRFGCLALASCLAVLPSQFFQAVLSWQSRQCCPGSPVLAVLSWHFCTGSPIMAVLSWRSYPGCPLFTILSWLLWFRLNNFSRNCYTAKICLQTGHQRRWIIKRHCWDELWVLRLDSPKIRKDPLIVFNIFYRSFHFQ
jgi:hypothetical protein